MDVSMSGNEIVTKSLKNMWTPTKSKRAIKKGLQVLKRDAIKYPRKKSGAFSRLATPAQKRAFWAKVRANPKLFRQGVGYVRQNRLKRGWVESITVGGVSATGTLSNKVRYAVYVQGRRRQPFHRESGWKNERMIINDNISQILAIFRSELIRGV
jgi:hypothetical protein